MRKEPREATRLVRVPVSLVPQIKQFLAQGGVGCPYYESKVPGGFPSPVQGDDLQTINILSFLIPHPEKTILIRMPDDSLEEEGFFRGDILIAEREEFPRNGDLAICIKDGDIFMTRLDLRTRELDQTEIYAVVRFRIHTLHGREFF